MLREIHNLREECQNITDLIERETRKRDSPTLFESAFAYVLPPVLNIALSHVSVKQLNRNFILFLREQTHYQWVSFPVFFIDKNLLLS